MDNIIKKESKLKSASRNNNYEKKIFSKYTLTFRESSKKQQRTRNDTPL